MTLFVLHKLWVVPALTLSGRLVLNLIALGTNLLLLDGRFGVIVNDCVQVRGHSGFRACCWTMPSRKRDTALLHFFMEHLDNGALFTLLSIHRLYRFGRRGLAH